MSALIDSIHNLRCVCNKNTRILVGVTKGEDVVSKAKEIGWEAHPDRQFDLCPECLPKKHVLAD